MPSATSFFILTVSVIQYSHCWVFNNFNFTDIAQRDLILKELDNEISSEELARLRFNLIFPGTKWCGAGNIADGYDDLGPAAETDKCCRAHDTCGEVIEGGETKYNLTNDAFYSRLSCRCDEKFRRCLRKDGSETSKTVGIMYFNVIGTQCYRKDYNVTGCKQYGGWLNSKCVEYSYDTNSQKRYQWFDVPNY